MKNLMLMALGAILFAVAAPAQCFGSLPTGVTIVQAARCSEIPGHPAGPFVNPASPFEATIGVERMYWSNVPGADPAPMAVIALDALGMVPAFGFGTSCLGYVEPNLMLLPCTINALQVGCQTGAVLTFAPDPALAGLHIYGQGYMIDTVLGGAAVSDVFRITIQ